MVLQRLKRNLQNLEDDLPVVEDPTSAQPFSPPILRRWHRRRRRRLQLGLALQRYVRDGFFLPVYNQDCTHSYFLVHTSFQTSSRIVTMSVRPTLSISPDRMQMVH
jgi:hypothetical protein